MISGHTGGTIGYDEPECEYEYEYAFQLDRRGYDGKRCKQVIRAPADITEASEK